MWQQTGLLRKTGLSGFTTILFLLIWVGVYAQQSAVGLDPLDSIPPQHYLTFRHDNDFLNIVMQGTDRYYTAGTYIEYSFLGRRRGNVFNKVLFSPHTAFPSFFTIGATQWMYTPSNLDNHNNPRKDYPYCGVLFLGLSRENLLSRKQMFRTELWLGTTGPPALADQTQVLVHHFIKSVIPNGWGHQIPTYPVINYNLYYETNLFSFGRLSGINGVAQTQTGTLLNNAAIGLDFFLSNLPDNFFPARIYNINKMEAARKLRLFLELKPLVKFVATDAILQGGLWGKKDYYHINAGDLQRVVMEGTGIIGVRIRNFAIDYRQVFESAEFKSVQSHIWGAFTITCRL